MSNVDLHTIVAHISKPRLRQYLDEAKGNRKRALTLYVWNAQLGAALFVDLGHIEVALRNALDARMTARHTRLRRRQSWLDDPTGEIGRDLHGKPPQHRYPYKDVAVARRRVQGNGKPLSHGQILSETPFGLWHNLVSKKSTNLWPDLADAFPHAPNRARETIADPLGDLRDLRNRIGHHHRIWTLPCAERHDQLLDLAGYIDPHLRQWIELNTTVPTVMTRSPWT